MVVMIKRNQHWLSVRNREWKAELKSDFWLSHPSIMTSSLLRHSNKKGDFHSKITLEDPHLICLTERGLSILSSITYSGNTSGRDLIRKNDYSKQNLSIVLQQSLKKLFYCIGRLSIFHTVLRDCSELTLLYCDCVHLSTYSICTACSAYQCHFCSSG